MKANPGGRGNSPLFSIMSPHLCVEGIVYEQNAAWSSERYRAITPKTNNGIKLAVVGGGESAQNYIDTLKNWDGEIWAIKGAAKWLGDMGVKTTFVSCHPTYNHDGYQPDKALLSSSCPRELFEYLKCPIEIFHSDTDKYGLRIHGGCTTLAKTPYLALTMGYTDISYFGCDSSMTGRSHVYTDKPAMDRMRIVCDGQEFMAQPDWIWQAEYMQDVFNAAPHVFKNMSNGLMAAMIRTKGHYTPRSLVEGGFVLDVIPLENA